MDQDASPAVPRSLLDTAAIARRRSLSTAEHSRPLAGYAQDLRDVGRGEVPDFDPTNAGDRTKALCLFGGPRSMISVRRGGVNAQFYLS